MYATVTTGQMHKLGKKFGGKREIARRVANFKNPFEYYMYQKKRKDKYKQDPIIPVSQRKVKVIKREVTEMEVS